MTSRSRILIVLLACVLLPGIAHAQASIAGIVRDSSGAVLPGVTVEARSPALIEQSRAVVTDGTGQYKIVDLRPGTYAVIFALTGFNTLKREGIELTGSFVATVNADLKVGTVEETITVTGESPIVDVQSTTKQSVLGHDVIDTVPTARNVQGLAVLIPAIVGSGGDIGGAVTGGGYTGALGAHGARSNDMRITQNGVVTATLSANGAASLAVPNVAAAQEVTIDTGSVSAEMAMGGARINIIPREGGNTLKGTFYGAFSKDALQGDNFTQRVQDRGLKAADSIRENWDLNPGIGGPLRKDRLWFYVAARYNGANTNVGGMFYNLNASNPNAWTFAPDLSRPARNTSYNQDGQVRLTWQATPRNKIAGNWDQQYRRATQNISATLAPEAAPINLAPKQRLLQAEWTSPITSRLLLETNALHVTQGWTYRPSGDQTPGLVPVLDQSNNLVYRGSYLAGSSVNTYFSDTFGANYWYRAALSYVTGAHAFKMGFNNANGFRDIWATAFVPVVYRVNTVNGVTTPNQVIIRNTPFGTVDNVDADLGVFAQDRWTVKHLTLTLGVRYDYFKSSFPEQHLGPSQLLPSQNLTFPAQDNLDWKDVTPRFGLVYDASGTGKTAFKVSLNKYLQAQTVYNLGTDPNPINALILTTSRSWNDSFYPVGDARRGNWVPDCNLTDPSANGECQPMANANFGKPGTTTFDQDLLTGWGHRNFNWEFSAGVQQAILPRVSVDVSYFRRWYGNFQVTDNTLAGPADYSPFSIPAPRDSRLPGGGGYTIGGLYDLNPDKVGQVQNYNTLSDKYGQQTEHWNGVDIGVNARLRGSALLQGGLSTGRTVTDNCDIVTKLDNPSTYNCHVQTNFLTQVKFLASYTVPRADVQLSGSFQSVPGPAINANYNAPNAIIVPTLGRNLSGGASNATVNLIPPGTMYGERLNELDLRFGKVVKLAGTRRAVINVDVYNPLNTDAILTQQDAFAVWQQATKIQLARFVKLGVQFDF